MLQQKFLIERREIKTQRCFFDGVPIMALLLAQPADGAEQIGPFGHQPAIAHLLPRFALSIV